jgi:hypothetical protein
MVVVVRGAWCVVRGAWWWRVAEAAAAAAAVVVVVVNAMTQIDTWLRRETTARVGDRGVCGNNTLGKWMVTIHTCFLQVHRATLRSLRSKLAHLTEVGCVGGESGSPRASTGGRPRRLDKASDLHPTRQRRFILSLPTHSERRGRDAQRVGEDMYPWPKVDARLSAETAASPLPPIHGAKRKQSGTCEHERAHASRSTQRCDELLFSQRKGK